MLSSNLKQKKMKFREKIFLKNRLLPNKALSLASESKMARKIFISILDDLEFKKI